MYVMTEEQQPILGALFEARDELYQRGTKTIFEALQNVLDGIATALHVQSNAVEWLGVEKVQEYIVITGITHIKADDQAFRIGLPLRLAETANASDVVNFLTKTKARSHIKKATHTPEQNDDTSFDLFQLTNDQIERIALSVSALSEIDPKTRH